MSTSEKNIDRSPSSHSDRLYFKQLLAGRDFGASDPRAAMMENFVYLIGDRETRECVVAAPAWCIDDLLSIIEGDGYTLTGALATHYHPDHIGGSMFGFTVEGLPTLMERAPCKVHAHKLEVSGIRQVTGLSTSDIVAHDSGDIVTVGAVEIKLLHTPGHTPGSQCFCVGDSLVAGDTLFLQGCGRVDLPGGDVDEMYYTLTQRLNTLPDNMVLYPGHAYGGSSAQMGQVKATNPYLSVADLKSWRNMHGQ